jgi:glycosyltransferase involved in cell wall biosynthesis
MVSIIIPVYNGIEFISDSINSVLQQTNNCWELLIGVNGHPENSDVYLEAKKYEEKSIKIKVFDFYNIKGKSNTLNHIIQYCNYNYIALLDVDDIWHPLKLEIQSKLLDIYDVIGSNCVYFGELQGIIPTLPVDNISNFDFYNFNPIINSSSIIRKDLCFWNSNWDGVEDYDLWLRLRKLNKTFFNFKDVLVYHRIHKQSAFNSKGNNDIVKHLLVSHGHYIKKYFKL